MFEWMWECWGMSWIGFYCLSEEEICEVVDEFGFYVFVVEDVFFGY